MAKTELVAFGGKITAENRKDDASKGSENVTSRDLAVPQLKLLQLISPEAKKHDPSFVTGAEAGMILNTATKELTNSQYVINVHYDAKYTIWNDSDEIVGSFKTEEEAIAHISAESLDPKKNKITYTPMHYLMLLDEEGTPTGAAILYMSKSKEKVSKAWNTLINSVEKDGKARYSHIYQLSAVIESSKRGEYFNFAAKAVVEAPDDLYNAAKELNEQFAAVPESAQEKAA